MNSLNIKYLSIAIFFLSYVFLNGQNERKFIDSLISLPYSEIVSQPKERIDSFKKGIQLSKKTDYKFGTAKLYSKLALAYSSLSEYDKYREAEIEAIKIFENLNNEIELTSEYGSFGYQLKRTNIKRSKYYMLLAIKLGEKHNLLNDLTTLYDNYGIVLEISGSVDSALYYYQKGLDLKYILSDSVGIPYSLNHLAGIYGAIGETDKAFEYMELSDKYRKKESENYGRAENAIIFGELYMGIKKYNLAIKKLNESLVLVKKIGNKYMAQYIYEKLAEIYELKNDYKNAFLNLKSYSSYKDSILNIETNKKIAELEIKFESEKKDKEITKAQLILKEQREQIIAVVSILVLLLLISYAIYQVQRHKRRKVREKLELENRLAKAEFEKNISDEKLRISRELHDNIGSNLTFMVSTIDNLTYTMNDEKDLSKLNKLSDFGRSTLNELRQTIWAMKKREGTLSELMLKLNELKKQIPSSIKIEITNETTSVITLTSIQTLNYFRVIQESIQNTIKYAEAKNINVHFSNSTNGLRLTIADDGSGFDLDMAQLGNGISNMKFRCEEVGGDFLITSNKSGTKIICNIPIK